MDGMQELSHNQIDAGQVSPADNVPHFHCGLMVKILIHVALDRVNFVPCLMFCTGVRHEKSKKHRLHGMEQDAGSRKLAFVGIKPARMPE